MIRKDLLKTIIVDNQSQALPEIWPRTLKIPTESRKIITLTGVRRSGKTYHLFNLMRQLTTQKVSSSHIVYLNFEDERLELSKEELDLIIQSYLELYPDIDLSRSYFFFDEIQEVPGWEKFIARVYRTISKRIFISGSNATLLSREIATQLRGRTITFDVFPLSFSEFVNIIAATPLHSHRSQDMAKLTRLFEQFMHQGGFPELVKQDGALKNKILQEYFNVMVLRDIIERYQVSQVTILKYFCKRVIGNSASEFTVHKVYNELKSQGYKISKDTLYAYQGYVEAVYLARFISKYSHSIVKTEMSQKKSYIIDQGMGAALDFKLSQDSGRLLETTVALELLKQGKHIVYYKNGFECDFVIMEKNRVLDVLQVTKDLCDEQTKNREIKGLIQTCQAFDLHEGTIITLGKTDEYKEAGITIKTIPAWQYFYS